jgi:uncharacterized protein (TIGR03067 family)
VFSFLLLATACESTPPPPRDASTPIDGTWSVLAADYAGQPLTEDVRKSIRLVIHEGTYTYEQLGRLDKAIVALDPTTYPKTMDITWTSGPKANKRIMAIYETTGDTLRVCYDLSGMFRPGEFRALPGTQFFLALYARERHF